MRRPSIVVVDGYEALSRAAADVVTGAVSHKPDSAIVVATGESPIGLYEELATRREAGTFDASRITVFQLDEYVGVGADDRRSLFGWMTRTFLTPLEIPHEHVVRLPFDGDLEAGCAAYDRAVSEAGGYDLAILGIGENGHVGFNEPPSDSESPTRPVDLTPESVRSSARYWGGREHVPSRAVTAGMAALLGARKTLLVASGSRKRDILHRALEGPVHPLVPASYLQGAPDLTVLLDREAWGDGGIPGGGGG
jgi:glucosamine-6-phosphate deaminase